MVYQINEPLRRDNDILEAHLVTVSSKICFNQLLNTEA